MYNYRITMQYVGQSGDYISGPYMANFNAGNTSGCFSIMILNDNEFELNETINLHIDDSSLPGNVIIGDRGESMVIILENDRK